MKSIKCQSCGLVNFAEAEKCKRCAKPLTAASSKIALDSKQQSPVEHTPKNAASENSSGGKTLLRVLPFVIFGVPLFLASKDRMFGPAPKVGGYVDTLQLVVLAGCTIGLVVSGIAILLTRNK
jgi:hypothetical protein